MWPALAYHFGLYPWDLPKLTPMELDGFMVALEEISKGSE